MIVYLNGRYVDRTRATVAVDDRGFLFGDGVYEVTRARNGRLFEAARHLRRLERGLDALAVALPPALDSTALLEISERLLRDNRLDDGDATVYLQITRGAAEPRTHHFPPAGTPPTVFLSANPLAVPDDVRARGATAITTPDLRWERCDLKTVQLLANVLAKQQAVAAGAFEAILVRDGIATELGVSASQAPLSVRELFGASELFLTGTTVDVMPVVQVDGRAIGGHRPGPVARELHAALRARLVRDTTRAPAL